MNFFAVFLLFWFISVKSTNATQDGTFHKNTMISVKSTASAQGGTFHENTKTNVKSSTSTQDGTFQKDAKTNVTPSTATQDGTFHENVKTNANSTGTEDKTFHENAKKNGNAGLNVVLRNDSKQASQLTRLRRSVSSTDDTQECYRHYFVEGKPPTGFENVNVRYICQGACSRLFQTWSGCFSTLYDLTYKIPIFSAYVLGRFDWFSIGKSKRGNLKFRKEPGLDNAIKTINYNIDSMYSNTGDLPCIHKGHLVPAETYSFSEDHIHSTFVYTNAVPQYATFNSGQWSAYEDRIRKYGKNKCKGDLYLLTGISDTRIKRETEISIVFIRKPKGTPKRMPETPSIVIPNSMWTAGCCISGKTVLGSFAVFGNNDPIKENIHMTERTVKQLADMIGKNVPGGINLFPGNDHCNDENYDVVI